MLHTNYCIKSHAEVYYYTLQVHNCINSRFHSQYSYIHARVCIIWYEYIHYYICMCIFTCMYPGQLEREERERATVAQNISRLQHEMSRLSTLISQKSGEQHRMEQDNVLMQNDFVHALKVLKCYTAVVSLHMYTLSDTNIQVSRWVIKWPVTYKMWELGL